MIMKNFKTLILGIGLAGSFALAGCGNSTLKEMESVKDKICACKDKACIDKIEKDSSELEGKMKELSEEEQKKALAIAMEAMACAAKLK